MLQAVEERRELDHELLGPDHFLLGLLSNVRGSAYKVLSEQGVTYEWARRVVAEKHDDTVPEDDDRSADASDSLDEDREALKAIGIDLDKVRDAVRETFGEDITERWGQRRGHARRGGGRGHRRRGPDGPSGEDFAEFGPGPFGHGPFGPGGRGRRGPQSRRFARATPSLHRVLHQMRTEMRASRGGSWDDGRRPLVGVVLPALFNSGDPAIDAIVEAADDPKALREAVDGLAGRATT